MYTGGIPDKISTDLSMAAYKRHPLQYQTRNLSGLKKFALENKSTEDVLQKKLTDSLEQLAQSRNIITKKFD